MLSKIKRSGNLLLFVVVMIFYIEGIFFIVLSMLIFSILRINRAKKFLKRIWIHLTMSALSFLFPKPMFIYYDPLILNKTKNIIISNHLSEFDWLMILTILYKLNRFDNICIILKNSLQNIPLLGYGMKYFGYIFLNRKIEKDRRIINDGIKRLKGNGDYDLLLFPEGTYLDSESSQVTKSYMEKNPCILDSKEFKPTEVLLPRITGFDLIRDSLNGNADGVIDITLLVNPYKKYPQDHYSYTKTLTDFDDRIGFVFYLDYVENIKDNDFIFRRFKLKEELIKKYKRFRNKEITTEKEFKRLTNILNKANDKNIYDKIYVQSEWDKCFYIFFIFSVLLLYFMVK